MQKKRKPRGKTVLQLVQEARSLIDPTPAIDELVVKYEGRIRTLAKRVIRLGMDEKLDELKQRGILGLLFAINKFDRKKGVQFYTYASWWIKGSMLQRDPLLARAVSLDSPGADDGETLSDVIPSDDSDPLKAAEMGEIWRLAGRLPRNQRIVILLRYKQGLTLEEAGARMGGITREAVRQFEKKALINMRELINDTAA